MMMVCYSRSHDFFCCELFEVAYINRNWSFSKNTSGCRRADHQKAQKQHLWAGYPLHAWLRNHCDSRDLTKRSRLTGHLLTIVIEDTSRTYVSIGYHVHGIEQLENYFITR